MAQAPICSLNPVPPPIAGILWEILQLTSVKYQTDIYIYTHVLKGIVVISTFCLSIHLSTFAPQNYSSAVYIIPWGDWYFV